MVKNTSNEEKKKEDWESTSITKEDGAPKAQKPVSWKNKKGELAVDVYETEHHIVIQAPIAGVKKDDLDISTEKDIVIIKGQRKRPEKREIKNFYTSECFYGEFRREVIIPAETDPSRIDAKMEDGVLIIEIPKIEKEKLRKIEV